MKCLLLLLSLACNAWSQAPLSQDDKQEKKHKREIGEHGGRLNRLELGVREMQNGIFHTGITLSSGTGITFPDGTIQISSGIGFLTQYVDVAGDTMTGQLTISGSSLTVLGQIAATGYVRGTSHLDTTGNSGIVVEQLQADIYASGVSQVSITTTTANWTTPVKFSSRTVFSGSPFYSVEKYGIMPTNTAAQNDAGLVLMAAQVPTGATIRWDQGIYLITSFSWPNKRWVWIGHSGVGTAGTVISGTGDPVIDFPVGGTNFSKRSILQNLTLVNSGTGRALRVENTGIRLQDVQINGGNTAVEITAMDSQSWDQVQIVAISTPIFISTNAPGYAVNNNLFNSVNVSCTNSTYGTGLLLNRNAPTGQLVRNIFNAFDVTNCGTGINIDGSGSNGNFFNSPWFENVDVKDLIFSTSTNNSYYNPRWTTTTDGAELSISGSGIVIGTTTNVNTTLDISWTAPAPAATTGPSWAQTGIALRDKAGNSNAASCLGLGYRQAGATYPPGAYCYRQTGNGGFTNGTLQFFGRSTTNDVAGDLMATFAPTNATFPSSVTASAFFGDGANLTNISGATETVNASLRGVGTVANPLGINSSSGVVRDANGFVPSYQIDSSSIVKLSGGLIQNYQLDSSSVVKKASGLVQNFEIDASSITKQGNSFNGASQLTKTDSNSALQLNGSVTATTGTLTGNAFKVGGSTFSITGGKVGIGTTSPGLKFTIQDADSSGALMPIMRMGGIDNTHYYDWYHLGAGSASGDYLKLFSISGSTLTVVRQDGLFGIGTVPTSVLHVDKGTGVGQLTLDGSTGGCIMLRDTDDAGWTECDALDGVLTCSTDADGVCD